MYTLPGKLAQCSLSLESEHSVHFSWKVHFPWKVSTVYTPWKVSTVYTLPGKLAQYTLPAMDVCFVFIIFLTNNYKHNKWLSHNILVSGMINKTKHIAQFQVPVSLHHALAYKSKTCRSQQNSDNAWSPLGYFYIQ